MMSLDVSCAGWIGGYPWCAALTLESQPYTCGSLALLTGFGDREAYSAVRSLVLERGFLPRPSASQRSSAKPLELRRTQRVPYTKLEHGLEIHWYTRRSIVCGRFSNSV